MACMPRTAPEDRGGSRSRDGRITGLYAVRNPAKLSHMEQETTLRR